MGTPRRGADLHSAREWIPAPHGAQSGGHLSIGGKGDTGPVRPDAHLICVRPVGCRAHRAAARAVLGERGILIARSAPGNRLEIRQILNRTMSGMATEATVTTARIASVNPATGEVLREFSCSGEAEVLSAVARARA